MSGSSETRHEVTAEEAGRPLDGVVRQWLGVPWGRARTLIESGKIAVDGEVVTVTTRRVRAGVVVSLHMAARRPRPEELAKDRIVFVDGHVVVVDKPAGISTVPFDETETHTLDALVRDLLGRTGSARGSRPSLGVVHRIDKETSGLVVFTRSWQAKQSLSSQFRAHTTERRYLALVHGHISSQRIVTHLVADRGDGLRGSIEKMKGKRPAPSAGQRAVTHITLEKRLVGPAGEVASLVSCRLETGRTHQIRVHLSEAGHPLLGERVYVRGFAGEAIAAPRLMLHAAELGFVHPTTEEPVHFSSPLPADFRATLARLGG